MEYNLEFMIFEIGEKKTTHNTTMLLHVERELCHFNQFETLIKMRRIHIRTNLAIEMEN